MSRRDALLALLVALLWGVNFVVIEWGMAGIPPLLFLALRFTVVVLPAVLLVPRPDLPWTAVARVGLLMSLGQFGLLYAAIDAGMPPGIAALVLQAQVLLTIVIAAGVLGERPSARQGVGVLVGSLGLAVVAVGRDMTTPLLGLLLCLGAALSWAAGNVAARAAGAVGGLSLTVWSALAVPVPALALSLLLDGPAAVGAGFAAIGVPALLSTLYTAVLASLVGYGIFTSLLGRYPAGKVVPWILLVPPVAMAAAWLVRGDRPAPLEVAGGCVLLAGAAVALLPGRRRGAVEPGGAAGATGTPLLEPADQRSGASAPCPDSV